MKLIAGEGFVCVPWDRVFNSLVVQKKKRYKNITFELMFYILMVMLTYKKKFIYLMMSCEC